MKELLKVADEKGFAVPAFNIGSDQLLKAVMQQVKEMKSPVILEMSPDEFNFVENSLIQSMIYEASKTDVPVVIHLDHGDKYETVVRAIQAGFTSVMIDASKLPYEENIAITQKVCEVAHLANVSVESELGTIGTTGNSIEGGTTGIIYTDPDQAKDFVEKTGIISKINISSDIKVAFYDKCREVLNAHPEYREPLEIYPEPIKACREVIAHKVNLFDSADKVKYYYE